MSGASLYRARHAFWVANKLEQKPEFKIIHTIQKSTTHSQKYQDKLGEFVLALKHRWTDREFQGLLWTFADDLNQISGLSKKSREDAKIDENLNVFVAKLTARLAWDFAWHGYSMLSDAFHPPPGCAIHTTRLACAWFVYAAPFIWAKVQDPGTKDENKGKF
ncbi:hypothetical protein P171DRAFT_489818 [Karstenula rhodostoma CBS 690.94]|uniref:Uncharacterized protein n=1 Tax=Karstenula rhodostoma CBS 690.94 TaxID=1392251 RepID=A0A9P4P9Y1_9PLEO|nr:hypothetical protein P171DRAFT_489818 [Karstenula rhodostoma CBS 690.94]